jgi:hypothetical protein
MDDGDYVAKHMNAFNTIVTWLILVRVNMDDEDQYMTLLCSFPNLWDNLVITITSTVISRQFN